MIAHDDNAVAVTGVARAVPSRRSVAIAGWLLPGGGEVHAPTIDDPCWRAPDGTRLSVGDVLAGQADAVRSQVLDAHTEAICALAADAARAKLTGDASARAAVAAASRLLHEIIGQG